MSLLAKIKAGRLKATKEKDSATKSVLTLLLGEVERINPKDASDEDVQKASKFMADKIEETIGKLKEFGQDTSDLEFELTVLKPFRLVLLTDAETEAAVDAAIAKVGADSMKQMGAVMGQLPGNANKALASKLVREKLS